MKYTQLPFWAPSEEYQVRTSAADAIAARGITMASAAAGWWWGNGSSGFRCGFRSFFEFWSLSSSSISITEIIKIMIMIRRSSESS